MASPAATGTATKTSPGSPGHGHKHGPARPPRLIKDLKSRGLLDDTIVLWTTEFGRMPCSQGSKGRDHNPFAFTNWLAGGGIKGGSRYGESDEWSYKVADRADLLLRHPRHHPASARDRSHAN